MIFRRINVPIFRAVEISIKADYNSSPEKKYFPQLFPGSILLPYVSGVDVPPLGLHRPRTMDAVIASNRHSVNNFTRRRRFYELTESPCGSIRVGSVLETTTFSSQSATILVASLSLYVAFLDLNRFLLSLHIFLIASFIFFAWSSVYFMFSTTAMSLLLSHDLHVRLLRVVQ